MPTLLSLPVELQLSIISHLPLYSSSLRPYSSLISLSESCRHFYNVLKPIINSSLSFTSSTQVQDYLEAAKSMAEHVRRIDFDHRVSIKDFNRVLATVGSTPRVRADAQKDDIVGLNVLRLKKGFLLDSLDDSSVYSSCFDLLDSLRSSLLSLELDLSASYSQRSRSRLIDETRGELELTSFSSSFSNSERLERFVGGLFDRFEQLQSLRIRNFELTEGLSSSLKQPTTKVLNIKHLEFDHCKVSENSLVALIGRARGTLKGLVLKECQGLTNVGISQIVKLVGSALDKLEISSSPSPQPLSTPWSSPGYVSPRSTPRPPLHPLLFALDESLPQLPNLSSLTLSGPLLSPSALSTLHSTCPRLRTVSLDSNPHLSPSDLVPLLSPSTNLPKFSALHFSRPASINANDATCTTTPSTPPTSTRDNSSPSFAPPSPRSLTRQPPSSHPSYKEEEDTVALLELSSLAISRNVRLIGKDFEKIEERLKWAFEAIGKTQSRTDTSGLGGSGGDGDGQKRRRKRPGICAA